MVSQEAEIQLLWAKLEKCEKDILKLAQSVAKSEVLASYNSTLTAIALLKPEEAGSYGKYMKAKCEAAEKAALQAGSIEEASKVALDFQNDCINYLKSRK